MTNSLVECSTIWYRRLQKKNGLWIYDDGWYPGGFVFWLDIDGSFFWFSFLIYSLYRHLVFLYLFQFSFFHIFFFYYHHWIVFTHWIWSYYTSIISTRLSCQMTHSVRLTFLSDSRNTKTKIRSILSLTAYPILPCCTPCSQHSHSTILRTSPSTMMKGVNTKCIFTIKSKLKTQLLQEHHHAVLSDQAPKPP